MLNTPHPGKPAIALVIGYDRRAGEGEDSLALRHAHARPHGPGGGGDVAALLPARPSAEILCPGHYLPDRINAAYATCQAKCAVETVKALTGLPINYLVTVNFLGFTQVVDKLGGIWMDVDRRYFHENSGDCDQYAAIDLEPGYQKLFGGDSLCFVRYRHTDNDLVRDARRQLFLRAVKDQITHDLRADTVPKVVARCGRTSRWRWAAAGGLAARRDLVRAAGVRDARGERLPRQARPVPARRNRHREPAARPVGAHGRGGGRLVKPDMDAPEKAAAAALGQKAKHRRGRRPPHVSVVALNGNGVAGAAANATAQLAERGYQALLPPEGLEANAPQQDYFRTQVLYREGAAQGLEAARQVANLFGSADVAPLPPVDEPLGKRLQRLSNGAMLVTIVGETFKGTLAQVPRDKTPERKPPNVVANPDLSRPYVREAPRQVLFPLQLPTVIDRGSTIDSERPVRVYKVNGSFKAVRLTYRTGGNEYWGIQQTDWTEAPVFDGRNTRRWLGGREYGLYFSGPKLHMVILRDGNRSYWVVNTLMDALSNETMLAIARGLKPLGNAKGAGG